MTYNKLNCSISEQYLRAYVLSKKPVFTLYSAKTKLRYTFRLTHQAGEWHRIERLYGDDNTKDYRYVGVFRISSIMWAGRTRLDLNYRFSEQSEATKQIAYFLKVLVGEEPWPETMYFYPSGRCARCGRVLTTPESIERGFGPKCDGSR